MFFFSIESIVFFIERSKERFYHGRSFSRINEIDLITVNLFKDQKDQKSEDRKIEFPTLIFLGPSALCSTYVVHRLKDYIY